MLSVLIIFILYIFYWTISNYYIYIKKKGEWEVRIWWAYQVSYFWNMTTCTQLPQTPHSSFNLKHGKIETFEFWFENDATMIRTDLTTSNLNLDL